MKITLVLLTYNERECLEQIYPTIPAPGPQAGFDALVAVDGGSTDGTLEFYQQHGVRVIGQSKRGRGEAFLQAFRELVDSDAYIFFSPDGNEDVNDLGRFKEHLAAGADLVIASRMMKDSVNEEDGQLFKFRKWANNVFNLAANLAFNRGKFVTDSINGYRAITRQAAQTLQLTAHDYTIEYQMTIRAMRNRMVIKEFPTVEGRRVAGDTGAPSIPTGLRFIKRFFTELSRRKT